MRFYRRLLTKPDAELMVGGLTRDEVADGSARVEETRGVSGNCSNYFVSRRRRPGLKSPG